MNCPRCGAAESRSQSGLFGVYLHFECGSDAIDDGKATKFIGVSKRCLTRQLIQLEAKRDRYRKALESLTPGGSEFSGDPERCRECVRELIRSGHEAKKDRVRLRRLLIRVAGSTIGSHLGEPAVLIDRETWDEIRGLRRGDGIQD